MSIQLYRSHDYLLAQTKFTVEVWSYESGLYTPKKFIFSLTFADEYMANVPVSAIKEKLMLELKFNMKKLGASVESTQQAMDDLMTLMTKPMDETGSTGPTGPTVQTGGLIGKKMSFAARAAVFSTSKIFEQRVMHPVGDYECALDAVIISLNDNHRWPRERIADWLETLDIDINLKPKEKI